MEREFDPLFFETLLLIARFNDNFLELASLLRQVYETSHHDFKTLISIPQLGPRKGYYLVEIDKAFGGNEHLRPRLNKIGWTKLQLIAKHVTHDNREDFLKLAEANTAKNLERIMHGVDPIIGAYHEALVAPLMNRHTTIGAIIAIDRDEELDSFDDDAAYAEDEQY